MWVRKILTRSIVRSALLFALCAMPLVVYANGDEQCPHCNQEHACNSLDLSELIVGTWDIVNYGVEGHKETGTVEFKSDLTYAVTDWLAAPFIGTYSTGQGQGNPTTYEVLSNELIAMENDLGDLLVVSVDSLCTRRLVLTRAERASILTREDVSPLMPTRLGVRATGYLVTLTWTDNSTNETGFNVLRKDKGQQWVVIATVGPDETTYDDQLGGPGKYIYKVQAANGWGDSPTSNAAPIRVR